MNATVGALVGLLQESHDKRIKLQAEVKGLEALRDDQFETIREQREKLEGFEKLLDLTKYSTDMLDLTDSLRRQTGRADTMAAAYRGAAHQVGETRNELLRQTERAQQGAAVADAAQAELKRMQELYDRRCVDLNQQVRLTKEKAEQTEKLKDACRELLAQVARLAGGQPEIRDIFLQWLKPDKGE